MLSIEVNSSFRSSIEIKFSIHKLIAFEARDEIYSSSSFSHFEFKL